MRIAGTQVEPPDAPAYLTPEALAEWNRIVPALVESGHLRRIDADLAGLYCQTFADYLAAVQAMERDGRVVRGRPHPAYAEADRATRRLWQLSDRLGLSPLARANIARAQAKADAALERKAAAIARRRAVEERRPAR